MSIFAFVIFLPAFLLALFLSQHRALGPLRTSALNPLLLVALFVFIAAADFASFAALGHGELGGRIVTTNRLTVLMTKYVGMALAMLLGVALAFNLRRRAPPPPAARADMRGVLLAVYIAVLTAWFVSIAAYSSDYFSLAGSVEAKFSSANDPVLYATSLFLLPTLCYALARQPYRVAVPLVAVTLLLVFFSGSRTRLLYALVPFFFYLVMVRGWKIRRKWFLAGVLVFGVLSIAALNVRLLVSYGNTASAEQVFSITSPLNSNDFAAAEANVVLDRLDPRRVSPYTGDNLVSFFTAPIPRAIFPAKPASGSVQFTMAYDPTRWRTSGSGLVIGALNEIEYDYPYPLALLVAALFGGAWGWALVNALRARSIHGFAWAVALYLFIYNFFRNDLFIAGGALWVFVLYWPVVEALRRARAGATRRSLQGSAGTSDKTGNRPGHRGILAPPRPARGAM